MSGTKLPNVESVEIATPGGALLTIATPGGVSVWPNGYVTVYRTTDTSKDWETYSPESVFRLTGPRSE